MWRMQIGTTRRAGCARLRPHRARCAAWAPAALVDLRAGAGTGVRRECEVGTTLERLHLDHVHERPLHATCHRWGVAMAAVMGRRTGRRCATTSLGCVYARRTAPRTLCEVSVRSAARRQGCGAAVCESRVMPLVVAGAAGGAWVSGPREGVLV